MATLFYACGDFKNCEELYVENVKIIEHTSGADVHNSKYRVKVIGYIRLIFPGWCVLPST